MLKLFLQHQNCNVNVKDTEGCTALMNVCRYGVSVETHSNFKDDLKVVNLLLQQPDIDVNIKKLQWSHSF